jgi:hypothetical protein
MTADWIYENRVPFGLLTDAERAEMQAHPGPWEACDIVVSTGWMPTGAPYWIGAVIYRAARPQPQHAQPPWDMLDQSIVAVAMDDDQNWGAYSDADVVPLDGLWSPQDFPCEAYDISFLIFPRGNMPWDESLVLRPGYEAAP